MAHTFSRRFIKRTCWQVYAALSGIGLILGVWAGLAAARSFSLPENLLTQATPGSTPLPSGQQRNLLIIGVNRLDLDDPRLESLWLALYFPGRSPVTLLPLYPSAAQHKNTPSSEESSSLAEAFALTRSGAPSQTFFERLHGDQVWWSGYILIDETGLIALIDFIGGIEMNGRQMDGAQALGEVRFPWNDPAFAMAGQTELLQSACKQLPALILGKPDPEGLLSGIKAHLRTDIDLAQSTRDWFALANNVHTLECEFPLLEANYP